MLVDSEKLANQVLVELIKPLGIEMTLDEAIRRFQGGKMADCIKELEAEINRPFPDNFVPMFRREMGTAFERDLHPVQGITQALEKIHAPICVASSGPREKIELSLTLTGLIEYFGGRIFSAYEINSWKPEPDLFLHAAKTMGYEPANCIVVEDSPLGVQAGIAAGMKVLGYAETDNGSALAELGATVFHSMSELPALISR